jgi:hypothetical protein
MEEFISRPIRCEDVVEGLKAELRENDLGK